ncbi:MAG: sulfotransferase family protein [Pyrinomonadaceae bacterium]
MGQLNELSKLEGWVPIKVYDRSGRPQLDWCYLGKLRFTDPFFNQTINYAARTPANLLFRHQTDISALNSLPTGLRPNGFIFHVSRCGSTLVCQTLAALEESIVISEAAVLDEAISSRKQSTYTPQLRRELFKGLINALGQRRIGNEQRLFLKYDAWNIIDFASIREVFPDVPWIFLYRDPVEVLVSQVDQRGAHMIPGLVDPQWFGLDPAAAFTLKPVHYCALVLAALFEGGLQHYENGGLLVNYNQLPDAIETINRHFSFECTEAELHQMRKATRRDAKNPALEFQNTREEKKRNPPPEIREAANNGLYVIYERLEAARIAQWEKLRINSRAG